MKLLKPFLLLLSFLVFASCRPDPRELFKEVLGEEASVVALQEGDADLYGRVAFWSGYLEEAGWDFDASRVWFARLSLESLPSTEKRPPLLGELSRGWNDRKLLNWMVNDVLGRSGRWDRELTGYLVHRTVESLMTAALSPGDASWREYRSWAHDEVAWAQLTLDLRNQLDDLAARCREDESLDYDAMRQRLYQSWLSDFNFHYKERFLMNGHLDFGKTTLSDSELSSLDLSAARWPEFDRSFESAGDDLEALYEMASDLN